MSYARCAVCISGNGQEQRLLRSTLELVLKLASRLTVIHVVEPVLLGTFLADVPVAPDAPVVMERDPLNDEAQLRAYAEEMAGASLPEDTTYHILHGTVDEELRAIGRKLDLMILGHHHMSALVHAFRHSVDERVLNSVLCKVLVVPE